MKSRPSQDLLDNSNQRFAVSLKKAPPTKERLFNVIDITMFFD
jgi:hypothetical protein